MRFVCLLAAAVCLAQPPDSLRIEIREGAGAAVPRNALSSRRFVVAVTDASGRPVPQATVRFRLPADGPSGMFSSGMTSESILTDDKGLAWVYGIRWNDTPGPLELRVSARTGERSAETVIPIEISATAAPSRVDRQSAKVRGASSGKKWFILAAVGAGAAAGLAFAGGGSSSSTVAAPPTAIVTPPSIGNPSIVIGKP